MYILCVSTSKEYLCYVLIILSLFFCDWSLPSKSFSVSTLGPLSSTVKPEIFVPSVVGLVLVVSLSPFIRRHVVFGGNQCLQSNTIPFFTIEWYIFRDTIETRSNKRLSNRLKKSVKTIEKFSKEITSRDRKLRVSPKSRHKLLLFLFLRKENLQVYFRFLNLTSTLR